MKMKTEPTERRQGIERTPEDHARFNADMRRLAGLTESETLEEKDERIFACYQRISKLEQQKADLLSALRGAAYALRWHMTEGAGAKAMDSKFLADAQAAIAAAEGRQS